MRSTPHTSTINHWPPCPVPRPAWVQLQKLALFDIAINSRALACLTGLTRLESLTLATSSSLRQHRLNADGCLSELCPLSALRELTVTNLAAECGLGSLTQLTALSLTLPDHTPDVDDLPAHMVESYM